MYGLDAHSRQLLRDPHHDRQKCWKDRDCESGICSGSEITSIDLVDGAQLYGGTLGECDTDAPSVSPTTSPTTGPTAGPTVNPTVNPTSSPTVSPTGHSCVDDILNGRETSVDCGGPDCPPCYNFKPVVMLQSTFLG